MRLLDTRTLKLKSFENHRNCPPYAILSHTWGEEVLFEDVHSSQLSDGDKRYGNWKILKCAAQAIKDRFQYIWVDTCRYILSILCGCKKILTKIVTAVSRSLVVQNCLKQSTPCTGKTPESVIPCTST